LMNSPSSVLKKVAEHIGISLDTLPLVGEREVELKHAHLVSGNPTRFSSGKTPLLLDEQWKLDMHPKDRLVASIATSPVRYRYGY